MNGRLPGVKAPQRTKPSRKRCRNALAMAESSDHPLCQRIDQINFCYRLSDITASRLGQQIGKEQAVASRSHK